VNIVTFSVDSVGVNVILVFSNYTAVTRAHLVMQKYMNKLGTVAALQLLHNRKTSLTNANHRASRLLDGILLHNKQDI
jgi:hypothetical protein